MSILKQFTLVAVLRLLGSLYQVLGPTYDRLRIPNFVLRKGNFIFFCYNRAQLLYYHQQGRKLHLSCQDTDYCKTYQY